MNGFVCRFYNLLGSGPTGAEEIKSHPFFKDIDWTRLANKEIEAPFKPSINHDTDTSNFSEEFTQMDVTDSPVEAPPNHERLFRGDYHRIRIRSKFETNEIEIHLYLGFSYVAPELLNRHAKSLNRRPTLEEVTAYNLTVR